MRRFIKITITTMPIRTVYLDIDDSRFTKHIIFYAACFLDVDKQRYMYLDCDKTKKQKIKRSKMFERYVCKILKYPDKQFNVYDLLCLQDATVLTEADVHAAAEVAEEQSRNRQ